VESFGEIGEFRVIGPPGTGKTSFLARQIEHDVIDEGRGSDAVVAMSFTKAAAAEIASRRVPLPRENVGTLHSFAYRALDRPTVVEDPELLSQFNDAGQYKVTGAVERGEVCEAVFTPATEGDAMLAEYSRLRNLELPRAVWPASALVFADEWEDFKAQIGGVDFCDMIELALRETDAPENRPEVIIADEMQDFSRLEMRLLWHWAKSAEKVVLAGDNDQTLYSWAGSDPRIFQEVKPKAQKVLRQSYRVPRAVHSLAVDWIEQIRDRDPNEYLPRDADGLVGASSASWEAPEPLLPEILAHREAGRSVMLMAACGYMLDPLVEALREEAIPFGNPWRMHRGDWNPLARRGEGSTVNGVLEFLAPWAPGARRLWTAEQVHAWSRVVKGAFRHGGKKAMDQVPPAAGEAEVLGALQEWMRPEALDAVMSPPPACVEWLRDNLLKSREGPGRYALDVALRRGAEALVEPPRSEDPSIEPEPGKAHPRDPWPYLYAGTIHSFKGSEADVVILWPDISRRGRDSCVADPDPTIRQFYVAFTRAREQLILCSGAGPCKVDWGGIS
jgi:hypothetical protein